MRAAAAAPSRRQQSRWQREQRQHRVLIFSALGLTLVVAVILAAGWVYDTVVSANAVTASVEGEDVTAQQLLEAVRPSANAIDDQARQASGGQRSAAMAQRADQEKRGLPDSTLDNLVEQRILEHEAARRGISVTQQDVDDKMRENVAQLDALFSATPAPTSESTPAAGASATPGTSSTPAGTPTPAPTSTPVPTLEPGAYPDALKRVIEGLNQYGSQQPLNEQIFRRVIYQQLLRQRLQEAIGAEVPTSQEQIRARVIQVGDEQKAKSLLQQIQDGADFADVAKQNSEDSLSRDKGGDLDWITRGTRTDAFDKVAFGLQPGQLSGLVAASGTYSIIQVLERDPSRPLTPGQLDQAKQKAFADWESAKRTSLDVRMDLNQSEREWVLRRIGVRS